VVTGGSSGIGFATARVLAEGGAEVWVFDLQKPTDFAGQFLAVDVTDPSSISAAFDKAGAPDIVIANAGTGLQAELTDTSLELWDRIIAINLTGVFQTVQAAAVRMKQRRSGSIVLTASTNSYDGEARLTAYNASKAGVLGILHTAANELGPFGIRVNAVCPGLIRTRLTQRLFEDPTFLRNYFQHIPLGRGGEPEEVALAIAFLASDFASYITGAALLVDGGQMATKFGTWDETTAEFADGRWRMR
jgi:NAD(P)-dependent dehydrogenase (short-subunit alcohol dehydrogenase family)